MLKFASILLAGTVGLSFCPARGEAQGAAVSRPTVMIVVEPNRTRVGGRDLRAAVSRRLDFIAVPVSFPRATDAAAWVAISPATNGRIAMRIRRANGRGASRVERAPSEHVLEWLVEGVRWLLEASADPGQQRHAVDQAETAEAPLHAPAGAQQRHPLLASEVDLERDLMEHPLGHHGAAQLSAPHPTP
ncbi:MAG: hypothetical protein GXP55_09685 [Deltaproteobacteria bacterium]|nr:hypothetical protein [Deltaproteobacteria bacterium]